MKKDLIYLSVIVILGLFAFNQCSKSKENSSRYTSNIKAEQSITSHFKNKYGEETASKKSILLSENELKDKLSVKSEENDKLKESIKRFKKVIAVIRTEETVDLSGLIIPIDTIVSNDTLKSYKLSNNHFNIQFRIGFNTVSLDSLSIYNKQTIVTGWKKKKGIFKKSLLTVEITNSNPYFKTKSIDPIVIDYPLKWYQKPKNVLPIGILIGVILVK